jgi:hypothetical protein
MGPREQRASAGGVVSFLHLALLSCGKQELRKGNDEVKPYQSKSHITSLPNTTLFQN